MDIQCPSCGEPWDSYHMKEDEPWEWGLSESETTRFIKNGARFFGPDDPARKAAEAAGWKFASNSVLSFTRCPACKNGRLLHDAIQRQAMVSAIADTLGDDEDGMECELADAAAYADTHGREQ